MLPSTPIALAELGRVVCDGLMDSTLTVSFVDALAVVLAILGLNFGNALCRDWQPDSKQAIRLQTSKKCLLNIKSWFM